MQTPVDWAQRTAQAETFAREVIATANAEPPDAPGVEQRHPHEFAELIHVWSLAHPLPPPVGGLDFGHVPLADGGKRYVLDRLTDGRVMCQLCFAHLYREDLEPVEGSPGAVQDVCRRCALDEREAERERAGRQ